MKAYEVTYQYSDGSKPGTLMVRADYYSINKEGNEVLYFWTYTSNNPIVSFASSIWLYVAEAEAEVDPA